MGQRIFVWAVLPALILLFLVPAAVDVAPAWTAKFGHGARGTFTARSCQQSKGSCFWIGDFVSADGSDHRSGVGIDGGGITAAGQQVPAVDSGDRVDVYPVGGGADWFLTAFFLVLSLAALGLWVAKVPIAAVRRRSAAQSRGR